MKNNAAEISLRASLGIMYLYSGIDLYIHPTAWVWAIPYWLRNIIEFIINLEAYIKLQGLVEIIFGIILLAWFLSKIYVRWAAFLSAFEFATILVLAFLPWNAQNFVTIFRDIGLLGASLALVFILRGKGSLKNE